MGIVIRRLRLLGPLAAILVLVAMGSADASGALSLYNAIVPVESGWKSAASDIAYGPVPRQNLDGNQRLQAYGPIQPMDSPNLLERFFGKR